MTPSVAAIPPRMPPLPVDVISARFPGPGISRKMITVTTKVL
jgi:hypothetical protein